MGIAYIMASLHISNHESLSPLLRILTAAELYLYNGFYTEHSMFEEAYKRGTFPYLNSAFTAGISNRVLESEHLNLTKPEYVFVLHLL